MWLWWVVALGVLALVLWGFARSAGPPAPPGGDPSPEAILKARYARGEIDREEYERRLSDLRK
jgi:putative membrane protein